MVRERGSGTTPQRVVDLLREEIKTKSKLAIAKATGLGIAAISRYSSGIGEPTTATLQKLADYFERPIEWLRGENIEDEWGEVYGDDLTEDQKKELSYEFWRRKALSNASAPIMVEIVRCLTKVPPKARNTAFALFRNLCAMIENRSGEELIKFTAALNDELQLCECQQDEPKEGES